MNEIGAPAQLVVGPILAAVGVLAFNRRAALASSLRPRFLAALPPAVARLYSRIVALPPLFFMLAGLLVTARGVVRLV
jgi:hypothetical protein